MLNLPKNIYIISIVMAFCFATTSMMVLISGILGSQIAPTPNLATLPMATLIVGTALSTIPAGMIMRRYGRKTGVTIGICIAIVGALIGFFAAKNANFYLFLLSALCLGFNLAFMHQGRFIIIENALNETQQADGITLGLLSGLISAIAGPQIGAWGKDLVASPHGYAGSFLLLAAMLVFGLLILQLYKNQHKKIEKAVPSSLPTKQLLKKPAFIIAAGSAAMAYALMSLLMTATPINMHHIDGHSLDHAKLVIQSHIVAMFLPSFISGALLKKGYQLSLVVSGFSIYIVVAAIAFNGIAMMHYWWALTLLGIGWNFIFVACTKLLTNVYDDVLGEREKFKAQSINDFIIFTSQAIAAFSAGWLLFNIKWSGVLWIALVISALWLVILYFLTRASYNQESNQTLAADKQINE